MDDENSRTGWSTGQRGRTVPNRLARREGRRTARERAATLWVGRRHERSGRADHGSELRHRVGHRIKVAEKGFRSIGSVRSQQKAEVVEQAAAEAGVEVETVLLDVTDADQCAEVL